MARRPGMKKVEFWIHVADWDYLDGRRVATGIGIAEQCREAVYRYFPDLYKRAEKRTEQTIKEVLERRQVDNWNSLNGQKDRSVVIRKLRESGDL